SMTGPFGETNPTPGVADRPFWRNEPNRQATPDFGETKPIASTRSSPRGAPRDAGVAGTPLRRPMIIGQCSWVPALAALGRDDDGGAGFGETNPILEYKRYASRSRPPASHPTGLEGERSELKRAFCSSLSEL